MAGVSAEIKRLLNAKDARQLDGRAALRGMLAEVRRQIVADLSAVRAQTYTAAMLRQHLAGIERYLSAFESSASREMGRLLDAAWEDGAGLVPESMRAGGLSVVFGHLPGPLLETLKDFSFHKISGLTADAFTRVRGELSLGILGQKTPHEVVQAIAGTLDKPSIFKSLEARAETIARTEMGRAFSTATHQGLQQAAASVPGMHKEWWHAGHPKMPRLSHLKLHGQRQPVNKPFQVGSLVMDYPRDPKAPAQEVINCGCEVVPWHPGWPSARGRTTDRLAAGRAWGRGSGGLPCYNTW